MSAKRIAVVGDGPGKHSYRIRVAGSIFTPTEDAIERGSHAGPNDNVVNVGLNQYADGELWHWNADTYRYEGDITYLSGDGDLTFIFPDGAFGDETWLAVSGQGQGRHDYSVATNSGDLDPHPGSTGGGETDHGSAASENSTSADRVSGFVRDENSDGHEIREGVPIQSISVEGGHAAFANDTSEIFDKGEASLVFFYMGDSRFKTLFQEGTRLNQALKGYDEKVLLKHSLTPQSVLSAAAHSNADRVRDPTRNNFERELRRLTKAGYTIDLYIISHGYRRGAFRMSNGSHGSVDLFDTNDVEALSSSVADTIPLRMVYQVNCWGSEMNSAWREVGAKAAAGSRYVNFFPNQFDKFATRWRKGDSLREALDKSNTAASRTVVHTYLLADAPATNSQWGNCPLFKTILSKSSCAKDYYTDRWGHRDSEWDGSLSGKKNINRASEKLIAGDEDIDNSSPY